MFKVGFNNKKYIELQSAEIEKRIANFGGKLYMEFGGKLFDDFHASRVLPGFLPDSKLQMLAKLKDKAEIILVINANDVEQNRVRSDIGLTYRADIMRTIDYLLELDFKISGIVIARYEDQPSVSKFKELLLSKGIKVFKHYPISGYPYSFNSVISPDGLGKNEYINTTSPLVIVSAPGPGSGKMATCLSQMYHDHIHGITSGYIKFETFPVWDLPISHPVNLAYEAATADLGDKNMIDPYHLEAYNRISVSYNRDVEGFSILRQLLEKMCGNCTYNSPTDMGVNMISKCIEDDQIICEAANQEMIRRYYKVACDYRAGLVSKDIVSKIESIMSHAKLSNIDRKVVCPALKKQDATGNPAVSIELPNGKIVVGKTGDLLGASSAALVNALKSLGNIDDDTLLIAPSIIESLQKLKTTYLGHKNPKLHMDETLMALSICATTNAEASLAISQLPLLANCEAHATVILSSVDINIFRRLNIHLTCEPIYELNNFYHK